MYKSLAESNPQLPELGVGITYSSGLEPLLEKRPELFNVIEVEPQTTWLETRQASHPYQVLEEVLEYIAQLPGRKLLHSVGIPVGGTVRPNPAQFDLLQQMIERLDSPWMSEHLSFNATPEFSTGFFLPPRQTPEGVETAARSIGDLQAALSVPIAVETGVNYLQPRSDEMDDGAFVARVIETANCGLLLDLHNLWANQLNGRQSLEAYLSQLPLERVWEIHLAGGMKLDGFWLDAHCGEIPAPLFELAKRVVPVLPNLKAVIFEIFPSFIPLVGLDLIRGEIERLHELWELRENTRPAGATFSPPAGKQPTAESIKGQIVPPTRWEWILGNLVIGRTPSDGLALALASDPGVQIINRLIQEFRASMLVGALRLTSRLMMLALGPDIFRTILADFWSKTPPHQFALAEAEAFAEYLIAIDLKLPQLLKVLEFERATIATLIDRQPRLVHFELDPLPMLRALAEGRLTDIPGQPGQYEVEITPDGPIIFSGVDLDSVQQIMPFH
jgi:uncharacterized protein (UPF0276 family)